MKLLTTILASVLTAVTLVSCEKELSVAGSAEGNSVLNVVTRSGESDATVSYPVTVYVMNGEGQCVRKQQILTAADQLQLKLEPMTYQVYAVGGATEGDYSLPGLEDATATSEVTLNADAVHGDLMTASNTVTMSEEESTMLTLTMVRRVMHLESLVINQVPKSVDAVTVTLAPLYDNLLLNGNYSATTSTQTVTLTEQADGTTWQNADELYMLPSNGNATITVKFSRGGTITSYAYSSPLPLEANKHIRITGTFTGTDELTLSGTITGATWDGTTTIEFTFDENGSATTTATDDDSGNEDENENGSGDNIGEGAAPAVGSVYKDCYVLSSTDDGNYTVVTLIHKDEEDVLGTDKSEEQILAEISAALPSFDINGITGWRLPTEEEASAFSGGPMNVAFQQAQISGTDINTDWYYCMATGGLKIFVGATGVIGQAQPVTIGQHLRPVATVKFLKE